MNEEIDQENVTVLSSTDSELLIKLLDSPPEPTDAAIRAYERYMHVVEQG